MGLLELDQNTSASGGAAAEPHDRSALASVHMLVRYKAWANDITFPTVMALPEGEALRPRPTRFGNMVHTLNHAYVVDGVVQSQVTR